METCGCLCYLYDSAIPTSCAILVHEQHQWTTFAEPLLNTFITASAKEFRVGIFYVLAWLYVIKYTFRISLLPNSLFFRIRSRTPRVIAFKQIHTCANESKHATYMFVNRMHVITESIKILCIIISKF